MIRKCVAAAGLALLSILAAPGAAQAYTAPEEPTIDLLIDAADIVIGEQVPILMDEWLPGSEAQFSVSADGVDGGDIGLTVLGSTSIAATVDANGTFTVGIVFPAEAVYTLAASGLDADGNAKTVSLRLPIGQGAGSGGGGNGGGGGGGGGGLPGTGFSSFSALLAGAGLAGIGAGVILLSRRSAGSPRDAVNING